MIIFFGDNTRNKIFAVQSNKVLTVQDIDKLIWVFGDKPLIQTNELKSTYLGPRAEMISPWSTNAVERERRCTCRF